MATFPITERKKNDYREKFPTIEERLITDSRHEIASVLKKRCYKFQLTLKLKN